VVTLRDSTVHKVLVQEVEMAVVAAGSRVLYRTVKGTRVLRTLRDVSLDLDAGVAWFIPVVGDVSALALGPGTADLPTSDGVLQAQVVVEGQGGGLGLRPIGDSGRPPVQRRGDMRSALTVPVRAALLPDGPLTSRPAPFTGVDSRDAEILGTTINASGGGLSARVEGPLLDAVIRDGTPGGRRALGAGSRLYAELDLPDGRGPAAAVLVVVLQRGPLLRARFHDIAPADRERLVRIVFARHRADLRERRRAMDDALEVMGE
jgi:hypothetical protein